MNRIEDILLKQKIHLSPKSKIGLSFFIIYQEDVSAIHTKYWKNGIFCKVRLSRHALNFSFQTVKNSSGKKEYENRKFINNKEFLYFN